MIIKTLYSVEEGLAAGEANLPQLPRDSREFLEASGQRIHLFVDGMDGVSIVRSKEDRQKSSERALNVLRGLGQKAVDRALGRE